MKWQKPDTGTLRIRKRFALFPTTIRDKDTQKQFGVWLDTYYVVQEYWSGGWNTLYDMRFLTYEQAQAYTEKRNDF